MDSFQCQNLCVFRERSVSAGADLLILVGTLIHLVSGDELPRLQIRRMETPPVVAVRIPDVVVDVNVTEPGVQTVVRVTAAQNAPRTGKEHFAITHLF